LFPDCGAIAQLGERLVRNEEVSGSIPLSSTKESTVCETLAISRWIFVSFVLLRLLASFDPTPSSKGASHVKDWANLQQRLRFIANLFRAYGEEKCLFEPLKAHTAAVDS
jgi:hypothetical protein